MESESVTPRRHRKRLEFSDRRDSILDSALALASRLDTFGITMAQVAEEEGVSKPVLYDHFANIDELLTALFAREGEQAVSSLLALLSERRDVVAGERLNFALSRLELYFGLIGERPDRWRMVLAPPLGLSADARRSSVIGKNLVRDALRELIAWAIPDPGSLDLELVAHVVDAAAERLAQLVVLDGAEVSVARAVEFAHVQVAAWSRGNA